MKSAIFFFAFAIQAFAYNPFPINAWIQRGNGEMIEVPELVGKPDPNKTYRIWFTNTVYEAVENEIAYVTVEWEEESGFGGYSSETNKESFFTELQAQNFINRCLNNDERVKNINITTCVLTNLASTYYFPRADRIFFQFEDSPNKKANLYFGIFDRNTNNPSYSSSYTKGYDMWRNRENNIPDSFDDEGNPVYYENQTLSVNGFLYGFRDSTNRSSSKISYDNYAKTFRLSYTNCIEGGFYGTMFPSNKNDVAYLIPLDPSYANSYYGIKSFGKSMGGIRCDVINNFICIDFPIFDDSHGYISGYIDICGASIIGDPSQELKIESFNIDFNVESEGMWRTNSVLNIEYCVNRRIRNYLTFTASIPSEWDEQYVCVERADNLTSEFIDIYGETKYPTAIISPNGIVTKGGRPEINVISGKFGETLRKTIKIELDYDDEYRAAEKKDFIQHRFYRLIYLDDE